MTREIFVSEQAFLSIVLSSAEVYRRESYGLLFGYSLPGKTIIEGAIAYQTAERRFSEVSLFERQNRIIQRVIARFPKYEYLGEFHSHADYRGREAESGLTDADLESMTEGEIALVVAINPRRRTVPWSTNRDGRLSGTLADFRFRFGGYTLRPPAAEQRGPKRKQRGRRRKVRPRLSRARVSCPYAVGLLRSA